MNKKNHEKTLLLALPFIGLFLLYLNKDTVDSSNTVTEVKLPKSEVSSETGPERTEEELKEDIFESESESESEEDEEHFKCESTHKAAYRREKEWRAVENLEQYFSQRANTVAPTVLVKAFSLVEAEHLALLHHHIYEYRESEKEIQGVDNLDENALKRKYGTDYDTGDGLNWEVILGWSNKKFGDFARDTGFGPRYVFDLMYSNFDVSDEGIKRVLDASKNISMYYWPLDEIFEPQANSVFESLVQLKKESLLKWYLKRGVAHNDTFGANAMELLLFHNDLESLKKNRGIVSILDELGFKVRYSETFLHHLSIGEVHQFTTRIPIASMQEYKDIGFEFVAATDKETLKNDGQVAHEADAIQANKDRFMSELDGYDSERVKECESMIASEIYGMSFQNYIEENFRIYMRVEGDVEGMKEAFFQREPGLVDCFVNTGYETTKPTEAEDKRRKEIDKVLSIGRSQDVLQTLKDFQNLSLTEQEKYQVFWSIARFRPEAVSTLLDNGYGPDEQSLTGIHTAPISVFVSLVEAGFDFDFQTNYGRSLVEVAAAFCNVELVDELYNRKYTYRFDSRLLDALGIALINFSCSSKKHQADLIRSTMQFSPKIEEYHMRRLAEVRTISRELYQSVVGFFPKGLIEDDFGQPPLTCFHYVLEHDPLWTTLER